MEPAGRSTGTFSQQTDPYLETGHSLESDSPRGRLNLVFLPYQYSDGTNFSDGSGYLAAYYSDPGHSAWDRLYVAGYVSPSGHDFADAGLSFWRSQNDEVGGCYGTTDCVDVSPVSGTSVGVTVWDGQARVVEAGEHGSTTALRYIPHANGIAAGYQGQITDHDDAPTMAQNMCSSWDLVGHFTCCQNGNPSQCQSAPQYLETRGQPPSP